MTLDGKTATSRGHGQWISCEESRALVHQTRGRVDAIAVGIGTVLADDPWLTARPAGPRTALRVVLDTMASLPTASRLVQSARDVPVLVAVTEKAPRDQRRMLEKHGCEILVLPGDSKVPITPLLSALGDRSMTNALVEGGGRVLGAFLDAGQVDEIDVFVAPKLEGGDHAYTAVRGAGSETHERGSPAGSSGLQPRWSRSPRSGCSTSSLAVHRSQPGPRPRRPAPLTGLVGRNYSDLFKARILPRRKESTWRLPS